MINFRYYHDNELKIGGEERKELVKTMQAEYGVEIAIQPLMPMPFQPYKNTTEIIIKREDKMNGKLEELIDTLKQKLGL